MFSNIRHFFRFIGRVIGYMPVLWNDEDWEGITMLNVIKHKIQRMDKCFMANPYRLVGRKLKIHRKMLLAIELIDRIMEDDFCKNEKIEHDKRWGVSKMVSFDTEDKNLKEMKFFHRNVRNSDDEKNENREFTSMIKLENQRYEDALEELFKILRHNIRGWWD